MMSLTVANRDPGSSRYQGRDRAAAMLGRVLAGLLACLGVSAWGPAHAGSYQLGQGMRVDRFLFSGYGNFVAESPHGEPARLVVDDLSLYVNGSVNRWVNPFIEAEVTGATVFQQGARKDASSGNIVLERFYNDFHLSSSDTLRVGKILSPVGDWNLIHAAPLVPTVNRPLTTYRGFAEYASGVDWLHESNGGWVPDWQIYWQPGRELGQRPDRVSPRHYREVFGAHVNWRLGLMDNIGLSYQQGELTTDSERYRLVGINGRKFFGRLMIEGEATTAHWTGQPAGGRNREWGAFALAQYRLTRHWYGVAAHEVFQPHGTAPRSRSNMLGISYKPMPALVWKLEYVQQLDQSREMPTGWSFSCAVLF